MKVTFDQQDALERKIKDYSNSLIQNSEIHLRHEMKYFQNTFDNIKLENGKYHLEAIKQTKTVQTKLDEFLILKEKFIADKEELMNKLERTEKIEDNFQIEYSNFKKSYSYMTKSLKV